MNYTTSDLSRRSGDIIAEAMVRPVTLTQRKKPRLVLLNVEEYERLRMLANTQKAYRIGEIPDELFEEIERAVELYANEADDT